MPPINDHLKKLRELTPALNKAADDAASIVQSVERLLATDLGIGIAGRVLVSDAQDEDDDGEYTEATTLVYRRVGLNATAKFRIAVAVERLGCDGSVRIISETPWAECPRDVKLASFVDLPALLGVIAKKAEAAVASVEIAQAAVREMLGDLSPAPTDAKVSRGDDSGLNRLALSQTVDLFKQSETIPLRPLPKGPLPKAGK